MITLSNNFKIKINKILLIVIIGLIVGTLSIFLSFLLEQLIESGIRFYYVLAALVSIVGSVLLFFLSFYKIEWAVAVFIISLPIISRLKTLFLPTIGPFEISIETIFLIILLFAWFTKIVVNKQKIIKEPLGIWITFFFLIGLISIFSARYPLESSRVLFAGVIEPVIFYYILINNIRNQKSIKLVICALIFSICIASGYSFFQLFSKAGFSSHGILEYRLPSVYYNPNIFAESLILTIPLLFMGIISQIFSSKWRKFTLFVLLVSLFALMMTYSRGAIVALAVSILFLLIKNAKLRKLVYKMIPLIILILVLQWSLISNIFLRRLPTAAYLAGPNAIIERLYGWEGSLAMMKDHFLTGIGLEMFKYNYPQYMVSKATIHLEGTHNLYLDIAIAMGVFGLIFFLIILGISIKKCFPLTKTKNFFIKDTSLALSASLIGYSTIALFMGELAHKHMFTNMLLLWTIIGLIIVLDRHKKILEKQKLL